MVRLNCEALVDLQLRYSPAMVDRGRGAIINVASTAAFQPIPGTATYAATKAFVLSLTEGTHSELAPQGRHGDRALPGPGEDRVRRGRGRRRRRGASCRGSSGPTCARSLPPPSPAPRAASAWSSRACMNRAGALGGQHAPRMLILPLTKRLWRQAK